MREAKAIDARHLRSGNTGIFVRLTLIVYCGIMVAWTAVWLLKFSILDEAFPWLATSAGSFTWWTTAKVLIWILPALWLIRRSGRTLGEVIHPANWKRALIWGGGIGVMIALTGIIAAYLEGRPFLPQSFSLPLFNILFIAPVFEELLARGALMGTLQRGTSFWIANILSAVMFVGMHVPGWYFLGTLTENVTQAVSGGFSIFLLGLAFGYAVHKSRSVLGGMIAHFLNNLAPNV